MTSFILSYVSSGFHVKKCSHYLKNLNLLNLLQKLKKKYYTVCNKNFFYSYDMSLYSFPIHVCHLRDERILVCRLAELARNTPYTFVLVVPKNFRRSS